LRKTVCAAFERFAGIIISLCFIIVITFSSNIHRSNDLTSYSMGWNAGKIALVVLSIERCDSHWRSKASD
jgi:hypothetical protein